MVMYSEMEKYSGESNRGLFESTVSTFAWMKCTNGKRATNFLRFKPSN